MASFKTTTGDVIFPFQNTESNSNIHYEAKLCILCIVSGFRNKDAPIVLLLFFPLFDGSDKILTCLKTCLWNPRNIQTQNRLLSSAQFGLVMSMQMGRFPVTNEKIAFMRSRRTLNKMSRFPVANMFTRSRRILSAAADGRKTKSRKLIIGL